MSIVKSKKRMLSAMPKHAVFCVFRLDKKARKYKLARPRIGGKCEKAVQTALFPLYNKTPAKISSLYAA